MKAFFSGLLAVLVLAIALAYLLPDLPDTKPSPVTSKVPVEVEKSGSDLPALIPDPKSAGEPLQLDEVLNDALTASPGEPLDDQTIEEIIETPVAEEVVSGEPAEPPALERWIIHQVQPGDTLSAIFSEFEIDKTLLYKIVNSDAEEKSLSNLRPGQRLLFRFTEEDDRLNLLIHEVNTVKSVQFIIEEEQVIAELKEKEVEKRINTATGHITASLFLDGQRAGLTDRTIVEMAGLFNYDIDFGRELQPNDYFAVIYESLYVDGEFLRNGNILAAEFINKGTSYRIVRFEHDGFTDYYNEKGQSRKKSFIRTPLNFRRISSGFTKARYHPVLKRWRAHKGVDYAAKTGTPVWATGNGTVKRIERQRGYGKVIYLQHGKKYTTVYGHLSRFKAGLKKGSKVKQGQFIGYVGQTGLATGPHLHYEFRINGKHVDPLSHKLPAADPIKGKKMALFKEQSAPLLEQLEQLKAPTLATTE